MPVAAQANLLNDVQNLLAGTWTNQALPGADDGMGGQDNPLSYNVMPLPQDPPGYILKNFTYYEVLQFYGNDDVALPATAPNRGNTDLQAPTALFYGQQVYFAEGPGKGAIVHVENGAWLNLLTAEKLTGPYPPPGADLVPTDPNQQPPDLTFAKQISVPHGNSILALGSFSEPTAGAPAIPDTPSTLPVPIGSAPPLDTTDYTTQSDTDADYQNPQPDLTANPNLPLQKAVSLLNPTHYISWSVSSANKGAVVNIPFEQAAADVTLYAANYWLLSTDGGTTYPYLAYSQVINMTFTLNGQHYTFPHVTANVVTKVADATAAASGKVSADRVVRRAVRRSDRQADRDSG